MVFDCCVCHGLENPLIFHKGDDESELTCSTCYIAGLERSVARLTTAMNRVVGFLKIYPLGTKRTSGDNLDGCLGILVEALKGQPAPPTLPEIQSMLDGHGRELAKVPPSMQYPSMQYPSTHDTTAAGGSAGTKVPAPSRSCGNCSFTQKEDCYTRDNKACQDWTAAGGSDLCECGHPEDSHDHPDGDGHWCCSVGDCSCWQFKAKGGEHE